MNSAQAYKRASEAARKAIEAEEGDSGSPISQDLASWEVADMVCEAIAYEFRVGPRPDWWKD